MARKNFRPKRRPKKKRGTTAIQRSRPQFNLSTLQITNKRPSTLRVPVQIKLQYYVKAKSTKPGDGFVGFWRANAPYHISYIDGLASDYMLTAHTSASGGYSHILDQMKSMYSHYYVKGSKMDWSIKFLEERTVLDQALTNVNPNQLVNGVYSGVTRDSATPDSSTQCSDLVAAHNFREHRVLCGSKMPLISNNFTDQPSTSGSKRLQGKCFYSPRKLLGVTDVGDCSELKYPSIGGFPTTPPPEHTWFCIDVQHALDKSLGQTDKMQADSFNDFYLDIKLSYDMVFTEPTTIAGSNLSGVTASGHGLPGATSGPPLFIPTI